MTFRRLVAIVAKRFPPKLVTDRVLPWTALLLATLGFAWAIWQYRSDVNVARVQATLDFHKIFLGEFGRAEQENLIQFDEDWDDELFLARCKVLPTGTDCVDLSPEQKAEIRMENLYPQERTPVRRLAIEYRLDTETLDGYLESKFYRFFNAVQICVAEGNCDSKTASSLFDEDIIKYLNDVCIFSESSDPRDNPEQIRKRTAGLMQALVENGSDFLEADNKESNVACDHLRQIECDFGPKRSGRCSNLRGRGEYEYLDHYLP